MKQKKKVPAQGASPINILTDDILLDIFDYYRMDHHTPDPHDRFRPTWKWHLLVHVCQRWRQIIFASSHRLDLQIICTIRTPVTKNLSIWPAFPIGIDCRYFEKNIPPELARNVIAALGHRDRISQIRFNVTGSHFTKLARVMRKPFPALTHLIIASLDEEAPVLPATFLGGSAPRLREIHFVDVPFPALPTLLLSTSDLVILNIAGIPPTGYISPKAMVVGLAGLTKLEYLVIAFQSATPRPSRILPPPVSRTVLPVLDYFVFQGACEYLENFVAQIDSPQLHTIGSNFLNHPDEVPIAQLSQFLRRSVIGPKLNLFRHSQVRFSGRSISFRIYRHSEGEPWVWCRYPPGAVISLEGLYWQFSNIIQTLSEFSATGTLSQVVHLNLDAEPEDDLGLDDAEWLHLLRPFSTVQTLYVCQELAGYVALALEDITQEMVAEVLPILNLIYLEGQPASSIEKFVTARRLSDLPVTVVDTNTEFYERLESSVSN